MQTDNNQEKLPPHLREFEYSWHSHHPEDKRVYVVADHKRKLSVGFYPSGGAPDLQCLLDSYNELRKISLQQGYHIAACYPPNSVIPVEKKTPVLIRDKFKPMLDIYRAELMLGPVYLVTSSEKIKMVAGLLQEFLVIVDTSEFIKGLDAVSEMVDVGDIRQREDFAREKMKEIGDKAGFKIQFSHDIPKPAFIPDGFSLM